MSQTVPSKQSPHPPHPRSTSVSSVKIQVFYPCAAKSKSVGNGGKKTHTLTIYAPVKQSGTITNMIFGGWAWIPATMLMPEHPPAQQARGISGAYSQSAAWTSWDLASESVRKRRPANEHTELKDTYRPELLSLTKNYRKKFSKWNDKN